MIDRVPSDRSTPHILSRFSVSLPCGAHMSASASPTASRTTRARTRAPMLAMHPRSPISSTRMPLRACPINTPCSPLSFAPTRVTSRCQAAPPRHPHLCHCSHGLQLNSGQPEPLRTNQLHHTPATLLDIVRTIYSFRSLEFIGARDSLSPHQTLRRGEQAFNPETLSIVFAVIAHVS